MPPNLHNVVQMNTSGKQFSWVVQITTSKRHFNLLSNSPWFILP